MKAVGPCTLRPNPDGFDILARAIVSQMISTQGRRRHLRPSRSELGPDGLTPAGVLAATEETARRRPVARQGPGPARPGRPRTQRLASAARPAPPAGRGSRPLLMPVRGIGVWTAQMFLIFSLGGWTCCRWTTSACGRACRRLTAFRICPIGRPCANGARRGGRTAPWRRGTSGGAGGLCRSRSEQNQPEARARDFVQPFARASGW